MNKKLLSKKTAVPADPKMSAAFFAAAAIPQQVSNNVPDEKKEYSVTKQFKKQRVLSNPLLPVLDEDSSSSDEDLSKKNIKATIMELLT